MQFIDLEKQQQGIRENIERRIKAVLDHGKYIMGPEVGELEKKLCAVTGAKHCVSCASGTDALFMVLMAWGIRPGDAVFVPDFTFFATAEVVGLLGATPILVDIEPDTFNMCPKALEKAIHAVKAQDPQIYPIPAEARLQPLTPRAIIGVDLFGQAADYRAILRIASEHDLLVMEDAAQSLGGSYHGKKNCNLGCHASATSFFPAKPLGCYGDGGAIFTEDDELAAILRSLRVHGKGSDKYDNVRIGINGRIDTIQAAILLAKLEVFEQEIADRQAVTAWYGNGLHNVSGVRTPLVLPECESAWAQYSILLAGGLRDRVAAHLAQNGIPTNIYYPKPMHRLDVFKRLGYAENDFPVASAISRNILALPFYPYMVEDDVELVCGKIREALEG